MLNVQTALPESALRPFIRAYVQREARLGTRELVEPVVARLGVMLEFEFAGAYEVRNYGSNAQDATFPISIIGPQTWRRARLIIRDHIESLVVMFQPAGFHALFGIPTAPLAETGTEGHAVLGQPVSRLHQRLGNLRSFRDRCLLLDRYFLHQLSNSGTIDPIYRALHLLTTPGAASRVEEVARRSGLNRRYLERKVLAYSGVSPNTLTRISRFSRALLMRSETRQTWTEIAYATGYHDQMHMIRDFRVFAGDAPTNALHEITSDHLINFALTDTPTVG
jgi:AraC-like DNA-binding protein